MKILRRPLRTVFTPARYGHRSVADILVGKQVEIRSVAGIHYAGVIRAITPDEGLGEIFELGSSTNPDYQRFVHVVDRLVQIHPIVE